MSGPKVIRVVSRAEVTAICQREIARVDAALAEWAGVLSRCGLEVPAEVLKSRRRLNQLLAKERWLEVQKEAPALVAWLDSRLEELVNAQFTPEARAARGRAGLAASSQALVAECAARGQVLSAELQKRLEQGDSAAVSQVLSQLAASADSSVKVDGALQDRLRQGESRQFLEGWLAAQATQDPRVAVAEKQMALLQGLGADVAELQNRLQGALRMEDERRRGLQLDGLCLELANAVREERRKANLRREIAALQSQLGESVRYEAELEAQLTQLQTRHEQAMQARAAASTREAVLEGLRELGYEVREGMETAWEQDGRLVLKHPSGDGYGVELGGRGEKLQVRAVGFGGGASASADKAAEERWCGELTELGKGLAAVGGQLEILRATAAGAQPVKRVVLAQEEERLEEVEELKLRRVGE